jgi:adenylate cyclase
MGQATGDDRSISGRLGGRLRALVSIADLPSDDDDARLRKRAGVVSGYITVVAPMSLPAVVHDTLLPFVLAFALSLTSIAALLVLARWKRFELYLTILLCAGPAFVLSSNALNGGVTSSSGALVWAFLGPAYALMALGPRRATFWLLAFVATLVVAVVTDPFVRANVAPPPYPIQLIFYLQNVGVPLVIIFVLLRYTDIRRRLAEARSDELLTNAIPRSIANRLRHGEQRIAEAYPATTITFADIASFTSWSGRTEPARLVALLDDLFSRFDGAADRLGVEKIKTVGDAYMAVAGAPIARADHALAAVEFGRAMLAEFAAWCQANDLDLGVRVGVASGPVVGGVIGERRILFDLWGATVNTAARMESSGVPGRVHLSASTRDLIGDRYQLEQRVVDAKGLGEMTTYLLVEPGERPGDRGVTGNE